MGIKNLLLLILVIYTSCSKETTHFETVKRFEKNRVIEQAKEYLNLEPLTVTADVSSRSMGTKHDFYSEGDYWWPDPKYPDSAYIRKDGMSNPENFVAHRRSMIRLSRISGALASAYLVTKDKKYLNQLMPHLKAWFINTETKMNPHLLYAQAIKGRVTGRGIGIIDTIHLIEVALAVEVIEASKECRIEDIEGVKKWFARYLDWITTHDYGKKERDNGNNHSTCWAMQVAAFARLTQNTEQLNFCNNFYKNVLLPQQMDEDGSFPKELSRTKPYGYSIFNLDAMTALAQLLTSKNNNLFEYETENSKSLKLGLQFLYPYIKNKEDWPYPKDVMYWNDWPTKQPSLLFGGLQLKNDVYIRTWVNLPEIPNKPEIIRNMPVRNPLLWVK
jgi:hypothetical protein